jgi:hypothetical protein
MATSAAAADKAGKKPAAVKTTTALANWDEKLSERARRSQKTVESIGTGSFLSFRGGILSYNGNAIPNNTLACVVLSSTLENSYYTGDYDPDNPASPVCFAFGEDQSLMEPHEISTEKQSDKCKGCEQNEWGSAEKGRGKACKNIVRLALISAEEAETPAGAESAKIAFAKLPVTSVKAWAAYVKKLGAGGMDPLGLVTEISVRPDAKSQFLVGFEAKNKVAKASLPALFARAEEADKTIAQPYQPIEQAVAAPKNGKGAKGKAAPAKRKY